MLLLRHHCTETSRRRKLFRVAYRITCRNKRLIEFRGAEPKGVAPVPLFKTSARLIVSGSSLVLRLVVTRSVTILSIMDREKIFEYIFAILIAIKITIV